MMTEDEAIAVLERAAREPKPRYDTKEREEYERQIGQALFTVTLGVFTRFDRMVKTMERMEIHMRHFQS